MSSLTNTSGVWQEVVKEPGSVLSPLKREPIGGQKAYMRKRRKEVNVFVWRGCSLPRMS